jgi:hypothetical protein
MGVIIDNSAVATGGVGIGLDCGYSVGCPHAAGNRITASTYGIRSGVYGSSSDLFEQNWLEPGCPVGTHGTAIAVMKGRVRNNVVAGTVCGAGSALFEVGLEATRRYPQTSGNVTASYNTILGDVAVQLHNTGDSLFDSILDGGVMLVLSDEARLARFSGQLLTQNSLTDNLVTDARVWDEYRQQYFAADQVGITSLVHGDPAFVAPPGDLHITAPSAAIQSGIGGGFEDIDGEVRPNVADLGADEYTGATACANVNCGAFGNCRVRDGAAVCVCDSGHVRPSDDPLACVEDACLVDHGGCDPLTACAMSTAGPHCTECPAGLSGTGATGCVDSNDCTSGGGCDPLRTCIDMPGGHVCGPCPAGYLDDGAAGCWPLQCDVANGGCDPLTGCHEQAGGRYCDACPSGYSGTGETGCIDIDECTLPPQGGGCAARALCTNTPGSHTCVCSEGSFGSGYSACYPVDCPADTGNPDDPACGRGGRVVELTSGTAFACSRRETGSVQCWGRPRYANEPSDAVFTAISAGGEHHVCGVLADGDIDCWGATASLPTRTGPFESVSVSEPWDCGIRTDGSADCWGDASAEASVPSGTFTAVSSGWAHACGLRTDRTIECWGDDAWQAAQPPAGEFLSLCGRGVQHCALRTDGSIACWGGASPYPAPPAGAFLAVACGGSFACALDAAGAVTCWGQNNYGELNPPSGSFTSVSLGVNTGCGLRPDHSVACWGWGYSDGSIFE